MFLMRDCAWTGCVICLFEPEYEFSIAGINTLSTEHPILPLAEHDLGSHNTPYIPDWATSSEMHSLYVRGVDISVQKAMLVQACGAKMCDGQHDAKERCCALTSGAPPQLILRCVITSAAAGVQKAKFQSAAFTRYLVDEEAMKVSIFFS